VILLGGVCGTVILWETRWYAGAMVGFSVGHFFLFCNVFRIERKPELIWAAVFVMLGVLTVFTGFPGWAVTFGGSAMLSAVLIGLEMRKPGYHGVGWRVANPGLKEWWEARSTSKRGPGIAT